MKKPLIRPTILEDLYVQQGAYQTKFILDPKRAQATEILHVRMTNSDGKEMQSCFRRWGTKLHVDFTIDERTPDGYALIDFVLPNGNYERFKIVVVK